jgi:hypothetical protein
MPTWARVDAAALDTSAPNEHRMSESPARVVLQTFRRTGTCNDYLPGRERHPAMVRGLAHPFRSDAFEAVAPPFRPLSAKGGRSRSRL